MGSFQAERPKFCTVNYQALMSNYQLSHLGLDLGFEPMTLEVGGNFVNQDTAEPPATIR